MIIYFEEDKYKEIDIHITKEEIESIVQEKYKNYCQKIAIDMHNKNHSI